MPRDDKALLKALKDINTGLQTGFASVTKSLQGIDKGLQRINTRLKGVRTDLQGVRTELRQGFADVRNDLAGRDRRAGETFEDAGSWPVTEAPPKAVPEGTVTFIRAHGGELWSMDSTLPERVVRRPYVGIWGAFKKAMRDAANWPGAVPPCFLVSGHPGIGKSLMLDVFLSWALHEFQCPVVVMQTHTIHVFYCTRDKNIHAVSHTKSPSCLRHFLRDDVLYGTGPIIVLHDVGESTLRSNVLRDLESHYTMGCIVAASTNRRNYHQCVKDFVTTQYVLPTLSLEEVKSFFAQSHYSHYLSSKVEERFFNVGGVLRHLVLKERYEAALVEQKVRVNELDFRPGALEPEAYASGKDPSPLVQYVPAADMRGAGHWTFVSRRVWDLWWKARETSEVDVVKSALQDTALTADVRGRYFERFVKSRLEHNVPLCYFPAGQPKLLRRWIIPKISSVQVFNGSDLADCCMPAASNTCLYIPATCNFPVVDFIVATGNDATFIQVTVADVHRPSAAAIKTLWDSLPAGLTVKELVWVVPYQSKLTNRQAMAGTKTHRGYDALPRYVCRLDLFMAWISMSKDSVASALCVPFGPDVPGERQAAEANILREVSTWTRLKATTIGSKWKETKALGTPAKPLRLV